MSKSKASGAKKSGSRPNITYGKKNAVSPADILAGQAYVKYRPLYYIAAFLIPALLTLIAYARFGVYPFNERSVLALDLNGQYIYYFEAIRDAFRGDGSVFYNWSRNLSGEFMGITGYYLASPFTLIIILFPRKYLLEAMLIMQLCKVGAAGLTFSIYAQKSKNVPPLQSILFSTMYALMAYVAIQLIDPMWIDGPVFLPLIILGVEYLIDDGRKLNYIIPLAVMFVAEFYIGYMIAIFVAIYFFYYLFFGTKRKFNGAGEYFKTFGLMAVSTIVVLMLSIFMILPVYNGLSNGKFTFSEPDFSYRNLFQLLELVPTLLPNQYYSVNVDETTNMYGRPEIYCGVLTVILLPLFYMNKNIKLKRKIGGSLLILALVVSMYVKPINMLWHGGQDPNWLPYRYSFLLSFVMVSIASEAFAHLEGYKLKIGNVLGIFAGVAAIVYIFTIKMDSGAYNYNQDKYQYVAKVPYKTSETFNGKTWDELWLGTIAIGVILAAFYLIFVYAYSNLKKKQMRNALSCVVAAVVFFEASYNAYDTFKKVNKEVAYSNRSTYQEIMSAPAVVKELENYDSSFYRAEKTYQRCVNDNLAYGLKGMSHSSSVMNAKAISFIEALGYFTQSYETQYKGATAVADSILGIKYVINDPNRNSGKQTRLDPTYEKIYDTTYINNSNKETTLEVYENPNALSVGFAASDDILKLGHLGNDNQFNSMNIFLSTISGDTDFQTTEDGTILINGFDEYFYRLEPEAYEGDSVFDSNQVRHSMYSPTDGAGNVIASKVHHAYDALAGAIDPVVNMHVTTVTDDEVYLHIDTDFYKGVNVWVSSEKDAAGNFYNHQEYGQYLDTHIRPIIKLGKYPAGTELEVRFTIQKTKGNDSYTGQNEHFMFKENGGLQIYNFDYNAFVQAINKLKVNQWEINTQKSNDRYLEGEVDIDEGQLFFTSIPYEDGWTIKVDGKKVSNLAVVNTDENGNVTYQNTDSPEGEVIMLQSLIGIKLPAGHHTISMKYTPPGFSVGVFTFIIGIGILVMFYIYDKKNNKVLIALNNEKERRKQGLPPEKPENEGKKSVQIIKSKGAVAETALNNSEKKPDEDNDSSETDNKSEDTDSEENSADSDEPESEDPENETPDDDSYSEDSDDVPENTEEKSEEKPKEDKKPAANNQNQNKNNSGKKNKKKKKK